MGSNSTMERLLTGGDWMGFGMMSERPGGGLEKIPVSEHWAAI
jgi:hypothetical protein